MKREKKRREDDGAREIRERVEARRQGKRRGWWKSAANTAVTAVVICGLLGGAWEWRRRFGGEQRIEESE